MKVRLGEHDLFNDNDGAVDATPLNIIVHENYTGRPTYSHDIAIIQLETNVSYTGNTRKQDKDSAGVIIFDWKETSPVNC